MLIIAQVRNIQVFQLPSDALYYWQGTEDLRFLDSPKGWLNPSEAMQAAIETVKDFKTLT